MAETGKIEGKKENIDDSDSQLRHQITCEKCGMVYEIRYIPEHCRMVEGKGYFCMNCNTLLGVE